MGQPERNAAPVMRREPHLHALLLVEQRQRCRSSLRSDDTRVGSRRWYSGVAAIGTPSAPVHTTGTHSRERMPARSHGVGHTPSGRQDGQATDAYSRAGRERIRSVSG